MISEKLLLCLIIYFMMELVSALNCDPNCDCSSYHECYNRDIYCTQNTCNITCSGKNETCRYSTIYATSATTLNLHCNGWRNCQDIQVYCATNCNIICTGSDGDACTDSNITCGTGACNIDCRGYNSCVNTLVDATQTSSFHCTGDNGNCNDVHNSVITTPNSSAMFAINDTYIIIGVATLIFCFCMFVLICIIQEKKKAINKVQISKSISQSTPTSTVDSVFTVESYENGEHLVNMKNKNHSLGDAMRQPEPHGNKNVDVNKNNINTMRTPHEPVILEHIHACEIKQFREHELSNGTHITVEKIPNQLTQNEHNNVETLHPKKRRKKPRSKKKRKKQRKSSSLSDENVMKKNVKKKRRRRKTSSKDDKNKRKEMKTCKKRKKKSYTRTKLKHKDVDSEISEDEFESGSEKEYLTYGEHIEFTIDNEVIVKEKEEKRKCEIDDHDMVQVYENNKNNTCDISLEYEESVEALPPTPKKKSIPEIGSNLVFMISGDTESDDHAKI